MKQRLIRWLMVAMILALTACSAATTPTQGNFGAPQGVPAQPTAKANAGTAQTSATSVAPTAAASAADALAKNSKTHEAAGDYNVDNASAAAITLNGSSISAQSDKVKVEGSQATISAAGIYTLSGTLNDGQIIVNTKDKETVKLVLNGATITSSNSAPIYVAAAEKVVIVLADKTNNTLTDGKSYVFAVPAEEEPNAAIFSKANLSLAGSGSLTVNANFRDGIASKDGLIIAGGSLTINAADDGIRGKDYLVVKDGALTINSKGDGLKSDNENDAAKGYIAITAGSFQVTAGGDAINAQTDVTIQNGKFTLTSGGGSSQKPSDAVSTKGIKGLAGVYIENGSFNVNASDDALHSNGGITINGGTLSLASGDDGIHADATITINGGDIKVTKSYEGIESAVITINQGTIHVAASDDGINGAGGMDASGGMNPGFGGRQPGGQPGQPGQGAAPRGVPGQDGFASGKIALYIHGGYVYVDANGDGIDINGTIEMTDGVVVVNGPTEQMNGALDYDAGFKMTGGFLVAAGSAGMAMTPNSGQNTSLIYLTSAQAAGTLVHIQNSAGEDLLTFAPTKAYQSVAFASPKLATGQSYTIYTGGSSTSTATDGLYQGGKYTPGSQAASFTVTAGMNTIGSGGRGGGPGGRRP